MSEHVNEHDLAQGQRQGDHHPENPLSEHKYPIFFRLFNRGDNEARAPLDIDDDHYFVQNGDAYRQALRSDKALAQEQAEALQVLETSVAPSAYVDSEPEQFDVMGEAYLDGLSRQAIFKVASHARAVATKLGMKNLSEADAEAITKLSEEYKAAIESKNKESAAAIYDKYDTLRRRGVTKDVFDQYVEEVNNFANSINSQSQTAELVVEPEIFKTIEGGDMRMGGWYDADVFPDQMKKHWVENGLVVQVPKVHLDKVTSQVVFGKEVGNRADAYALKSFEYTINLKKKKAGAKLAMGIYGGMALWAIYFKWIQSNQREYYRQKSKVALRFGDAKLNPVQAAIAKKHMEWAAKYYEEDSDE